MRLYESVFIARQDVSTTQVENLTKDFTAIIENGGGKILKHEYWGLPRWLTGSRRTGKAIMSC